MGVERDRAVVELPFSCSDPPCGSRVHLEEPVEPKIAEYARLAGVVGAGGAGFPTHVKLGSQVDTYLVNGAECEPLLYKDKELMRLQAGRVVDGLSRAMEATGANRGIIAVKAKYSDAIQALRSAMWGNMELCLLDNFYPAGDEVVIVHEATGRTVPPGGIPLQVGCAVNNVETLLNLSLAVQGTPVTTKAITVCGAVETPISFVAPLGISARQAIAHAGGALVRNPTVIEGGPMMGAVLQDLDAPCTKTTGGYVVLPTEHPLIRKKTRPDEFTKRIGRSSCDQCSHCTELCPRYLLGYAVEPHKVMRGLGMAGESVRNWALWSLLCCECGLCSLYSCPEDLNPHEVCIMGKHSRTASGDPPRPPPGLGRAHPMRTFRKTPVDRLIHRLGLADWDLPAPMVGDMPQPGSVRLMLKQNLGAPALPIVQKGSWVDRGQLVAKPPQGALGANLHASISGKVERIDATSVWLVRSTS